MPNGYVQIAYLNVIVGGNSTKATFKGTQKAIERLRLFVDECNTAHLRLLLENSHTSAQTFNLNDGSGLKICWDTENKFSVETQ